MMREAFGALAALRLIDVANGRKPRVGAMDGAVMAASLDHAVSTAQISVPEIWDVRRTIELRTAELAATERTDAEAARDRRARRGDGRGCATISSAMTPSRHRLSRGDRRGEPQCLVRPDRRLLRPADGGRRAGRLADPDRRPSAQTMIDRHHAVATRDPPARPDRRGDGDERPFRRLDRRSVESNSRGRVTQSIRRDEG